MTNETQLDFVEWLRDLSRGVEIADHYWLETEDGDANGGNFCGKCVHKAARKNILKATKFDKCKPCKGTGKCKGILGEKLVRCDDCDGTGRVNADGYTEIHGGGSAMEEDSQPHCDNCGAVLNCSPTKYMIDSEIEWLTTADEMGATNAASFREWLTGMGDYQREEHWPKIAPHAKRLMRAAGVKLVRPGKIRFAPADALRGDTWPSYDSVWLGIYEWFARKLVKYAKGKACLEYLCETSGLGCTEFQSFDQTQYPRDRVAALLAHVGEDSGRGRSAWRRRRTWKRPSLSPTRAATGHP